MRKSILILTIFMIFQMCFVSNAQLIIEKKDMNIISSGIIRYHYQQFTTGGWQNINVIEVDLQNENVKVDLLYSNSGIKTLATVNEMANQNGAVAVINSDFFSTSNYTQGYPIGFAMKNGKVISSTYYGNSVKDTMASFSINDLKQTFFSYIKNDINIITSDGQKIKAADINKVSATYELPTIYTPEWNSTSVGAGQYGDMVELVVQNDIVTDIRVSQASVAIPQDGYVISARGWGAESLQNNFKVGDSISYTVDITPDLYGSTMAVGGDTILVNTGVMAKFTHTIGGVQPRTALGVSKDGRYMYLVTVDGRKTLGVGMTLEELANFMISIGSYNAINFDGGGSTSMVSRNIETNKLESNTLSKDMSALRRVANGVGVFTTKVSNGSIGGLIISTSEDYMFPNTKKAFSVSAYDEYYNPISINTNDVTWSVKGVNGSFNKNVFTALEPGEATIVASYKGASGEYKINVLSNPIELSINPSNLTLKQGDSKTFSIRGKDATGYRAYINVEDMIVNDSANLGTFNGNTYTLKKDGETVLSFKIGEIQYFVGVNIAPGTKIDITPTDSGNTQQNVVENKNTVETTVTSEIIQNSKLGIDFLSYPKNIEGNVRLSAKEARGNSRAIRMNYDFTKSTEGSKAAYIVFNNPIELSNEVTNIGLWLYNDKPRTEWFRAYIVDADSQTHMIDFTRDLSSTGWQQLKITLGNDVKLPAKWTRVYLVQTNESEKSEGSIFVDEITIYKQVVSSPSVPQPVVAPEPQVQPETKDAIPENIRIPDPAMKDISITSSSDSFQFIVLGNVKQSETLLEKIYERKLLNKIDSNTELLVFIGEQQNTNINALAQKQITVSDKYEINTYKNCAFISMNNSTGGSIRQTNANQWLSLISDIRTVKADNIFILLPIALHDGNDVNEAYLMQEFLTNIRKETGKNIWIISKRTSSLRGTIDEGTEFIYTRDITANVNTNIDAELDKAQYMVVKVNGKDIGYQIKEIF